MENNIKKLVDEIDSLKKEIDTLSPIDKTLEQKILQKFRLDWNYHSNNIEGNQLTFGETKSFLLHGITANGKPLKDHLDIKGHNEAILYLDDIIKDNREISENFIRELHIMILKEPYEKPAITPDGKEIMRKIEIGKYKQYQNHVKTPTGEIFYFAEPEETPAKMMDLIDWYRNEEIHPILLAALFHYRFVRIHPFDDGNGRLARILMNLILMKAGYPPVVIKTEKKQEYYQALQQADGGDTDFFINYIGGQLLNSLNLHIKGAKGENIEDEDDIDKQIKLLKKELEGEDVNISQNKIQNIKIYNSVLKPTISKIFEKIAQFSDLFENSHYEVFVNNTREWGRELEPALDYMNKWYNEFEYITSSTGIKFSFYRFKKKKDIQFNVVISFLIQHHKNDDALVFSKPEVFDSLEISYKSPSITEKQIIHIANSMAKYVLDEIQKNLKKEE